MKWLSLPTTRCWVMARSLVAIASLLVCLSGCKPSYPNCGADSDCPGNAAGKEWCINGQCQQCRPEPAGRNDCGAGKRCVSGRCEAIQGFCSKPTDCPTGICEQNRCTSCKEDKQCPGGTRCSSGRCEADSRKACKTSDDCSETEDCVNGRCTPANKNRYGADGNCKLETVFFGYNEFELNASTTAIVDKNAECLKRNNRGADIVGHTDPRGTPEYNLALSDKRAQAVKNRMNALGVAAEKLIPVPRGELDSSGTDESSWERDRRVDTNWR